MHFNLNSSKVDKQLSISFSDKIKRATSSSKPLRGSVLFHLGEILDLGFTDELICFVLNQTKVLNSGEAVKIIRCVNPKLEYSVFLHNFIIPRDIKYIEKNGSWIASTAKLHDSVDIHPGCFIGDNCEINEGCVVHSGVKIMSNCHVGRGCKIGPNTVIGYSGFSVEKHNNHARSSIPKAGRPIKTPHFGGVVMGDFCDIGALNTIASGTIDPTFLGDYVCTDDHVHIAHNCEISNNVLITAHVEISGSVKIGSDVWIGPNSSIKQKLTINREAVVGIGTNLISDVDEFKTEYRNP